MAGAVKFFEASDPFSLTDWEVQNGPNPSLVKQRASALNKSGDEFKHGQYGAQYSGTVNYVCKPVSGYASVPKPGQIVSGWHIDSWVVTYTQTGWPTLAITCHKHDTTNGGTLDSNCRTYSPSFKVPACFGVPASVEKSASGATGAIFALSQSAVVGLRGMTLSMSVNHVDEPDRVGEHFASDNYDGTENIGIEFTGEVESSDYTLDSDWTDDTLAQNGGNTVASTASLSISHHVAHDANTGTSD